MTITVKGPFFGKSSVCEPILNSLPQWFGMEEANTQYLRDIETLPTFLAFINGETVGFLTLRQHNEYAAEIHTTGVYPEIHRKGVGRALMAKAEEFLKQEGIEYLQVKTLGPSHPSEDYARTRAFYLAMGFRPLEEFRELWNEENPCLLMVKKLTNVNPPQKNGSSC
ncbi:GNAT family N-acetyltransferase [Candidatus Poribacteria bacterium]